MSVWGSVRVRGGVGVRDGVGVRGSVCTEQWYALRTCDILRVLCDGDV